MVNRKFDITDKELERRCVQEVITRIEEIDGPAGIIAAQDIVDIVKQNLGKEIYNMGLEDAKKLIQNRAIDLETELDLLKQ